MTTGFDIPVGVRPACLLCGSDDAIRMGLMRYRDRDARGGVFASGWRCTDHAACRRRFEERSPGERWPLEDGPR